MKIFKSIGMGFINGFPMLQTIFKNRKTVDGQKLPVDYISAITELLTVIIIIAFLFGKISIEDVKVLIDKIK